MYPGVDGALEETEVLVEHAQAHDGGKREDEAAGGADVPEGKDDTGVDDLGVPEHVHGAHGHVVPAVSAVVHSSESDVLVGREGDYKYVVAMRTQR